MRYIFILFTLLVLLACTKETIKFSDSKSIIPNQSSSQEIQETSIDSVIQYLLTSAANDFHTHGPSQYLRFRDMRIGHIITQNGEKQYLLCGMFLVLEKEDAEWTPFATIKTSGYEQWIGDTDFCKNSSVTWEKFDDLTFKLQSLFDSLR